MGVFGEINGLINAVLDSSALRHMIEERALDDPVPGLGAHPFGRFLKAGCRSSYSEEYFGEINGLIDDVNRSSALARDDSEPGLDDLNFGSFLKAIAVVILAVLLWS